MCRKVIKVFIDLTHLVHLFGDELLEVPKPAEENAPVQGSQQPDSNKNREQSPPQGANGPGVTNAETQPPTATRRLSGTLLDFLHPAFFRPGRNAGRPRAANRVKAKKPKGGKGAKGRRGKQKEVEDGKLTGLETQEGEKISKS